MPFTTAGPELTELPAPNCHRIAPVAVSSANICFWVASLAIDEAYKTPFATVTGARSHTPTLLRIPDELSRLRIEQRVDTALLAGADHVAPMFVYFHAHDIHSGTANVPFLPVGFGGAPRNCGRLTPARLQPWSVALHAVGPPRRASLHVERHNGLQERARLFARLSESRAPVSRMAVGHAFRFRIRLSKRAVDKPCRNIDRGGENIVEPA